MTDSSVNSQHENSFSKSTIVKKVVSTITTFIKNMLKNIINKLYLVILTFINLFMMYMCSQINLFLSLITIDGIYYAIDYFKQHADVHITESQVMNNNNNLYKVGTTERYIYYSFLTLLHVFFEFFVCNCNLTLFKYVAGLTLLPVIFNKVIYVAFQKIFQKIIHEKTELTKKICCVQTANIIIHFKKIYFGENTTLDKQEIISMLENVENVKTEVWKFVKTFLIVSVLIYLRKNSSMIYYKIAKYVYLCGYGEYVKSTSLDNAKKIFEEIINNKKYDQITSPMFIQSIIELYNARGESDGIQKYAKRIKSKFYSMAALWTFGGIVSRFFTGYYITLIIFAASILLIFTRKINSDILHKNIVIKYLSGYEKHMLFDYIDDRTAISLVLTLVCGYFTVDPLFLSFVNQFSGILLFNTLIFNLIKVIYVNTNQKIISLFKIMHSNKMSIAKYTLITTLYYVLIYINTQIIIFLITAIINFMPRTKMFKYLYPVLLIGLINNNNDYIRSLILSYIVGIIDNLAIKQYLEMSNNKTKNKVPFGKISLIKSNYFGVNNKTKKYKSSVVLPSKISKSIIKFSKKNISLKKSNPSLDDSIINSNIILKNKQENLNISDDYVKISSPKKKITLFKPTFDYSEPLRKTSNKSSSLNFKKSFDYAEPLSFSNNR